MEKDKANILERIKPYIYHPQDITIGRSEAVTAFAEHKETTNIDAGRTELHSELCIPPKLRRQKSHIQGTPVFKNINEETSAKTGSKNHQES